MFGIDRQLLKPLVANQLVSRHSEESEPGAKISAAGSRCQGRKVAVEVRKQE
jgi:hypothetical protein